MKFSSTTEYFYKLQNRYYALLLLPLTAIITYYLLSRVGNNFLQLDDSVQLVLRIILPLIALAELTIVHLVVGARVRKIARVPALGDRLDQFVSLSFLRGAFGVSACMTVLVGLFLTGDQWFTICFFVCVVVVYLLRPTPSLFARQFQLKGDERELILRGKL